MDDNELRSLTPGFPLYSHVRHFIQAVDGASYILYRNTYNAIWEHRGNPQETVDWADPDQWIQERLDGKERDFALSIWHQSNRELNPRYLRGVWLLSTRHEFLARDQNDFLRLTPRGKEFIQSSHNSVVAEVDNYEGILNLLQIVAERGPGKRSDFLEDYSDYCQAYTMYRSEIVIKGSLYDRLVNIIERKLVNRNGQTYEITDAGLAYLDKYVSLLPGSTARGKQSDIIRLTKEISKQARVQLSNYLSTMDPFKFEELIKFLLEEMGYTDVETTSPTNDKGVDVIAKIQLGISSVVEVIQAKRYYNHNVRRNVLDELRGSLHRFDAVRATIITTGGFAKGTELAAFEKGAAPITLIDGEKLIDLLIEYGIGIAKKSVEYFEFDSTKLAQFDTKEAVEPES